MSFETYNFLHPNVTFWTEYTLLTFCHLLRYSIFISDRSDIFWSTRFLNVDSVIKDIVRSSNSTFITVNICVWTHLLNNKRISKKLTKWKIKIISDTDKHSICDMSGHSIHGTIYLHLFIKTPHTTIFPLYYLCRKSIFLASTQENNNKQESVHCKDVYSLTSVTRDFIRIHDNITLKNWFFNSWKRGFDKSSL